MSATTASTERVVVIGAGMVGHRFVEELLRLDRTRRFSLDLVGAEEYEPYNRILLSEVLAGRSDLRALGMALPDPDRVRFHRGVAATAVDREARQVRLDDGTLLGYDRLVLATGARAFVPPLPGLERDPRHVHVLRTLDDCRHIAARAMNAKHAVVLGGGVLGLEAACGLRRRGVPVTVVDLDAHPMAVQLDAGAGEVLVRQLAELGVETLTGTSIEEVVGAYGELVAVRLTDGRMVATDLLVVSCGVRAESSLALEAGLEVDRGVVVDATLSTSDPRVYAIGDCAQPPEGGTGLLAPGWRQAERLAAGLAAGLAGAAVVPAAAAPPAPETVRLKAAGVDLVTMGVRPSLAAPEDRVLSLSDPAGFRHVDLVLRDGVLVGATCLGAADVSAAVSLAYDRGTPVPRDPLSLLVAAPAATESTSSPVRMPGSTTVCRCNAVTKKQIVAAWEDGARTTAAVAADTRASTGCGGCTAVVRGIVDWLNTSDPPTAEAPTETRNRPVRSNS